MTYTHDELREDDARVNAEEAQQRELDWLDWCRMDRDVDDVYVKALDIIASIDQRADQMGRIFAGDPELVAVFGTWGS